jgi:hypothetical protein
MDGQKKERAAKKHSKLFPALEIGEECSRTWEWMEGNWMRAEKPLWSMGQMANNHPVVYACFMDNFIKPNLQA